MSKQKKLKRRIRARAIKTGESYTAARRVLLTKSHAPHEEQLTPAPEKTTAVAATAAPPRPSRPISIEEIRRAAGRSAFQQLADYQGRFRQLLDAADPMRKLRETFQQLDSQEQLRRTLATDSLERLRKAAAGAAAHFQEDIDRVRAMAEAAHSGFDREAEHLAKQLDGYQRFLQPTFDDPLRQIAQRLADLGPRV